MQNSNVITNNLKMGIEMKQFYDSSQTYLEWLKNHDEKYFTSYIKLCKAKIPLGSSILDCGCGIGTSSYLLAKEGFKVTAMDISPLFVSEAKKYGNQQNLRFLVGDASKVPFPDQSFDAVCSYDLLEHVTDVKSVLKEMGGIVKLGGLLIIFMPNHLDPIQYFASFVQWKKKKKNKYKPWEANSRMSAFWYFIKTTLLLFSKAMGINKKIYYLKPVLSDDENTCGEDFDATWLSNIYDIKTILKEYGFSVESMSAEDLKTKIYQRWKMFKLPKVVLLFLIKMRARVTIVAKK